MAARATIALTMSLWGAACTASVTGHDACADNAECRAAFGIGWVCYANKTFFLTDAAADTDILDETNGADTKPIWARLRGTRPAVPTGLIYDFFRQSYSAEYEGQDASSSVFNAHSYDAGWLAVYGTAWSHFQTPAISSRGMAAGLRRLSAGQSLDIKSTSWNDIKAQFEAGNSIDINGASGSLNYDPVTEETTAAIEVWQIDTASESFEVLYSVEP